MARNTGPVAGLLLAALIVVRYLLLRGGAFGAHGAARSFVAILLLVALVGARVFLFRRR
jgi:hypothetical protein